MSTNRPQPNLGRSLDEEIRLSGPKRPYHPPQLRRLGMVSELTHGAAASGDDGEGGGVKSGA